MTRKLIGFQIADRNGVNIQGDEGDPSGMPSFYVMDAEEVTAVVAAHADLRLLIQPIYEGDVQEPTFRGD